MSEHFLVPLKRLLEITQKLGFCVHAFCVGEGESGKCEFRMLDTV